MCLHACVFVVFFYSFDLLERVFYMFVFLESRFLIDLFFGGLWCSFCSAFAGKRPPNRTQMGPKRLKWIPKCTQNESNLDHGPKDVSREGSAKRSNKEDGPGRETLKHMDPK